MTTTTINLTVSTIDSRNIPFFLQLWKHLGDINVFTDDIIQINSNPNLTSQHQGFASVFGSQKSGSVGPDTFCPWRTGDYSRASGEILLNGNDFTLTVETP